MNSKFSHLSKLGRLNRLGWLGAGMLFWVGCNNAPADGEAVGDSEQAITEAAEGAAPDADEPGSGEPGSDKPGEDGQDCHDKRRGKRGRHGKFGRKGAPALFGAALHKLTLNDEQRSKIEGLVETSKSCGADAGEEHKAFREALASGAEAGQIDNAIVETHASAMAVKMSAKRDTMHAALNELHATLTPEQRVELTSAMRTKMAEKKERFAARDDSADSPRDDSTDSPRDGKRGRHGKRGRRGKFGKHKASHGKVGRLLKRLDLNDGQREQLREAREANKPERPDAAKRKADWQAHHERMNALLDAFAATTFDASKQADDTNKSARMQEHLQREVDGLNLALPILTAEQRGKLAELLRAEPSRRDHHRGRRGKGEAGRKQGRAL